MDSKHIEKLDRRRFYGGLWGAISVLLFLPGFLFDDLIVNPTANRVFGVISIVGFLLTIAFGIWLAIIESEIRSHPELKAALNNEMVRMYRRKSYVCAACAALVTSLIMDFLASRILPEITVHMTCMTIYFTTATVGMIVWLIYMRK